MANNGTPSPTSSQQSPSPKQYNSPPHDTKRPIAGYLFNTHSGPTGQPGIAYDYLLAQNGLYVQAESPLLTARIHLAPVELRGLAPATTYFILKHGPIPPHFLQHIVDTFASQPHQETFATIAWDGSHYTLHFPPQEATPTSITYVPVPNTVAEFHSHPHGPALFSSTDDQDEQAFRAYGLVTELTTPHPTINLRVGIYGHHAPLPIIDLLAL